MTLEEHRMHASHMGMKRRWGMYALAILPSAALGVFAMIYSGLPPMLWGQQAAAYVLFALLFMPLSGMVKKLPAAVWTGILLLFLAASLFGVQAGGARRWIALWVFNINAAQLVLPALLVLLGVMDCPYPALLCAAAVLSLQPDISQLTALAAAALPVLWRGRKKLCWSVPALLLLAGFMVRCAFVPTVLESVAHSDGMLSLLGGVSPVLLAAGCVSLALIPAFFVYRFRMTGKTPMLSLALYIAVMCAFSGRYPVPFIGFGLSPIAGYWLAYAFLSAEE